MNFFSKNRFVFWLLIFLIVILLTAFATSIVYYSNQSKKINQEKPENPGNAFRRELSLSPSQSGKVDSILQDYRNSTEPIVADIRNHRIQILDELAKDKPDKSTLNKYIEEISQLQKQMQNASVNQYMALKQICTPDQCQRLSALYFELYGFKEQGKGHGKEQRKGNMRRYRGGREQ